MREVGGRRGEGEVGWGGVGGTYVKREGLEAENRVTSGVEGEVRRIVGVRRGRWQSGCLCSGLSTYLHYSLLLSLVVVVANHFMHFTD